MPPRAGSKKRSASVRGRKGKAPAAAPPSSSDDEPNVSIRRPRDTPTAASGDKVTEPNVESDIQDEPIPATKLRSIGGRKRNAAAVEGLSVVVTDKLAAHQREMQAYAAECFMGVSQFPLHDPPATMRWGKHNTRNVNDNAVTDLYKNFEKRGLHNADADSLIRIGIRPEWFAGNLAASSVGKTVLELPAWALTPEGEEAMREGEIIPYSGNHRKHVLKPHYTSAEKRLKRGENELKKLTPKDMEKASVEEIKAYEDKKEQVEILRSHFAQAALWGAQLYDLSK